MENEYKIKIEKQEVNLIHKLHAIYSLKVSHKFGSKFPSKQVMKRSRINHMSLMSRRKNSPARVAQLIEHCAMFDYQSRHMP